MKKITALILSVILIITLVPCVQAAPRATVFDFTTMSDSDITNNLPNGWGVLNGAARTSKIVDGQYGLNPDLKYLEITNTTNSGAWGAPPVYPSTYQFKDYENIAEGDKIHITATIAPYDSNFYQLGIVASRANVKYTDINDVTTSVGDVNFSGSVALMAFEKDANGNVILTSWGNDITPTDFSFEAKKFYKFDCVVNGITNTMDAYLNGKLIKTVDYSSNFAGMTKNSTTYDFTDTTKYKSYYVNQFKRIGIVQHKPKTYAGGFTVGITYAGITWYGASDDFPAITFMPDDFGAVQNSQLISSVDKASKIVMLNKQATVSEIKAEFSCNGILDLYKDSVYTEIYNDTDFIEYPVYARYYTSDGFKLFDLPMYSEVYIDNGAITVVKNTDTGKTDVTFTGKFVNLKEQSENAIVVLCGYKNGVMKFIHMVNLSNVITNADINETISTEKELDRIEGWAIDTINERSVVSKIIYKDIV